MSLPQRSCHNHPQRRAIGVCVIIKQAICGECSTRYEGVNYSKEGLTILQSRRAESVPGAGVAGRIKNLVAIFGAPLALWATWDFWVRGATLLLRWLA